MFRLVVKNKYTVEQLNEMEYLFKCEYPLKIMFQMIKSVGLINI